MENVLISGGSRGIGKSCVYEFIKKGCRVFFTYNESEEEAKKISSETGAVCIKCDVSNSEEVKKMSDFIHNSYGKISVIVNNAGISQIKLFCDLDENDWDNMFNVNVKGMFLVTKEFIKDMICERYGKIINISSMWGETGASCEVHYSASKAAVIGFTKALAKEMGPSNINVNCISPGVIDTDMNKGIEKEDLDALLCETPLMRIGNPDEVARLAVFLASPDASFITGQIIGQNGGMVI